MKGFKAFNGDLTCRDYQFSKGKEHIFVGTPILCVSGFHFCTELKDVVKYYLKPTMRVFEVEATGIITVTEPDCTKRACSKLTLVKELTLDQVKESITDPRLAYWWAKGIGDREHMIQYVTDPQLAYLWAKDIGDKGHMKQYVTDPYWAYMWAYYIGDKEHMKQYVTDPQWAYWWAKDIGDKEHMKQYVTDPQYAYYWAKNIGDKEHMKQYVTDPQWAYWWVTYINKEDETYFKNKGIL